MANYYVFLLLIVCCTFFSGHSKAVIVTCPSKLQVKSDIDADGNCSCEDDRYGEELKLSGKQLCWPGNDYYVPLWEFVERDNWSMCSETCCAAQENDSVEKCEDLGKTLKTCASNAASKFPDDDVLYDGLCSCSGPICEYYRNPGWLDIDNAQDCARFCCEYCKDAILTFPRNSGIDINNTVAEEGVGLDATAAEEEPNNGTSTCDTVCFCYGFDFKGEDPDTLPKTFTECSSACDSKCGDSEECQASVAPLFANEGCDHFDEKWATDLLSEWQEMDIFGGVCACKEMGFKVGKGDIKDLTKDDCGDFCNQESYGGIEYWKTSASSLSTTPTTGPTQEPTLGPNQDTSNPWWWAIPVIIVGNVALLFVLCFKKGEPTSGSE